MNILVVSATQFEVKPLLEHLQAGQIQEGLYAATGSSGAEIRVLIAGIGMVNTAYSMGCYDKDHIDLALNVGICGVFGKRWPAGSLVHVTEDILSELGAEDGEDFLSYDRMQLPGTHRYRNRLSQSYPALDALPEAKGITVNTVHGSEPSIKRIEQLYGPDVESMEGAAFYAGCRHIRQCTQIRSISNDVEKRDKSKWQMPLAVRKLNEFLLRFLEELPRSQN